MNVWTDDYFQRVGESRRDAHDDGSLAPLVLWLDQFVWVRLARAKQDPASPYVPLLDLLREKVNAAKLIVPLSATNYLELWQRASDKSRRDVAEVMAEISGYRTLLAFHELEEREVAAACDWFRSGRTGEPRPVSRDELLGRGVNHTFASQTGRFRFVESIATAAQPEGGPAEMTVEFATTMANLSRPQWEWLNLNGIPGLHDFAGVEVSPEHRLGDYYVARQNHRRDFVATGDESSLLFRDIINSHLEGLQDVILRHMTYGDIDSNFRSPVDGASFASRIPTLDVMTRIEQAAHRNPRYTFSQHDRDDVMNVSQTVPYCDAIWVDAHWTDMAARTKCDEAYGTILVRKLDQAIDLVASL